MPVHKIPPSHAVKEKHELSATWAVVKKKKTDPVTTAFPRLSLRSTKEIDIAYGIQLRECSYTVEFDRGRQGLWFGLVDKSVAGRSRGATSQFAHWKLQTRINLLALRGVFNSMGTEYHDVKVEVWRNFGSEDPIASWLFAPIKHAEVLQHYKGAPTIL